MSMDRIRELLDHIGLEYVETEPDTRLRADLGLDSGETTRLESRLAAMGVEIDLWAEYDYTLGELAELANRSR